MISVESGVDRIGHWVSESRDALADKTGAAATAWYGDIWFAAK